MAGLFTAGLDAQIRFSDYIRFFISDDLLTSSFNSDPYRIFAFTLDTAETTKCRRYDPGN